MAGGSGRDEVTAPGLLEEGTGPVDEVEVPLGPDEGVRGLLDSWAGRTSPGELTQGEATGALAAEDLPLTAVLARVAASLGRDAGEGRLQAAEGSPSRAVKALIADEPLDPLPVPEGLPLWGAGFLDPSPGADITAVGRRPSAPTPAPPVGSSPVGPSPVGPSPVGPSPVGPSPVGPSPVGLSQRGLAAIVLLGVALALALAAGMALQAG